MAHPRRSHRRTPGTPRSVSRRGFLQTAAGTAAVVGVGVALPVGGEAVAAPGAGAGRRGVLSFSGATNGAGTLSPAGDRLVAEVQNVLWSVPRKGGEAVAITPADLEPTRPVHSPTAGGSLSAPTGAAASISGC
ncbi:twin-arginine translocation signal domain-containing protein [Streptomyces griseocarneus]|uniref:twin-arginine translocation signal domain-containing protein n=1 Tax=Streptomyces griseocarneus TaxID=51201 RepID=UPI003D6CC90B